MYQLKHTLLPPVKYDVIQDSPTIGGRLKARRLELGLRVVDIAHAVGVTVQSVYQWESGDSKGLKPENLVAVAEYLKTTEKWLATGQGPRDCPVTGVTLTADEDGILTAYRQLPDDGKSAVSAIIRQLAATTTPTEGAK